MPVKSIAVAYITESLGPGGAERQLVELIKHLDRDRFSPRVLTYFPNDFFRSELENCDVPVHTIIRKGKIDLTPVTVLAKWLRTREVDIVQAQLLSANFYAVLARWLAGRGAAIVSERSQPAAYAGWRRQRHYWTIRQADLTIANSVRAQHDLELQLGFGDNRVRYIPNGLDFTHYSPVTPSTRLELRERLGWHSDVQYILTVANYTVAKNHEGILDSINNTIATGSLQRFVWVGAQAPVDRHNAMVARVHSEIGRDRISILGPRTDVVDLYRAADIVLLNSLVEGTPNVVLEALACGCPVIATDVADINRYVIPGKTGWLLPAGDTNALQDTLGQVSTTPSKQLRDMGECGRVQLLSLGMDCDTLARRHEAVYSQLIERMQS